MEFRFGVSRKTWDIETRANGAVKLVRALHVVDNEVDTRLGANQKVQRMSRGRLFAGLLL